MRKINLLIALSVSLGLASCNNGSEKTSAAETKDTVTTNTTEPVKTGSTLPMDFLTLYHTIKDYEQWRPGFDTDSVVRLASGLSLLAVERAADKPNEIKMVFAPSDITKAKAFIADPRLKDLMGKLGVISTPVVNFWSVIRFQPENQIPGSVRVEIVHKVKDYDAWEKVFNSEGPTTRADNGLQDIALGRGIDDPNLVYAVFGVTDMAKAKARIANPELKKLMEKGGVVGVPSITFYNDASK